MKPTNQLAVIIPLLANLVDQLRADQLTEPTACANFDVRGVLDHMMGGAAAFVPAFRGEETDSPAPKVTAGQVPTVAYRRAAVGPELRDGDTFANATEAPAGASPLEQLVAFSGRTL